MLPSQHYLSSPEERLVKQAFSSLVDSMRYLQRSKELDRSIVETKDSIETRLLSLETLKIDITEAIEKLKDGLGEARVQELSKQVMGFTTIAVDQMKEKITAESQKQLDQLVFDSKSERTKTVKSLEAFLAVSPLALVERSIVVEFKESAYGAIARYRCEDDIQYEFSLDTKASPFFRGIFRLGQFDRTTRIPIGLGKSWLKKEPVAEYQRLDQYILLGAEITESSLIAECLDSEKEARLKIVYTRQGTHSSLTLQHTQGGVTVDVTADPSLNAYLETEGFIRSMERLWLGINDLERRKVGLTKIVNSGKSILEDLDCENFQEKSWKAMAPKIREQIGKTSTLGEGPLTRDSETLDSRAVREKLKVLGPQAGQVAALLGLGMDESSE